ncbi:hypothetical protein CFBP6600_08920 [Xanthomonas arboricola pv. corylina]|uniref:Uncharacterized protein n=1 Tax=Xanthomonas arboricola pv. corylina TaxID=487821 RepID=A0A8D6UNR0_9XANT|nr:hypothetical protein XAC301_08910 [Xanthomonas arboricola pv. corylina]SUZ35032.1 VOC family protein [Xanthomonas arboricola pv. juglandis]CAE6719782.1 hypothetical protein XAC301_08910 [Xanthomonas arboricola pv. corylina]CAE6720077.1 hypothetical protein CFBP6600_08920 [Xanthomonas arboricola pv. corylina]CAE6720086.1 hypothetical protein CFBP6600_08920 [Xanthomonas arboricola pv. corylina]
MLHHVSLGVGTIEASAAFYDAVLGALGYMRVWSDLEPGTLDQAVGYGRARRRRQPGVEAAPGNAVCAGCRLPSGIRRSERQRG